MPRRGKFGRLPRAAPDLTSTIVSIAREMQARRDANIVDAWKNGGTFDGKPVTDDQIVAYWRARTKDYAKGDPMYETYKNTADQYDYAIHESRASTAYAQGKLSASGMASFYLNWAKKVNPNSEFYRTLQKDAAQFLQHAATSGRASAAAGKVNAYSAYRNGITQSYTGLGDTLTSVMTQIARDSNIIGQNQDLTDFMLAGQNDPGRMQDVLNQINSAMAANPAAYKSLTDAIKAYDPHWDGKFTATYYAGALQQANKGYSLLAQRATADGYTAEAKRATKSAAAAVDQAVATQSWPVAASYSRYRDAFDAIWNDPSATSADKMDAAQTFAGQVEKLGQSGGLQPAMANRLLNDAAALRGDPSAQNQPSFYENYLGNQKLTTGTDTNAAGTTTGENARFQTDVNHMALMKQAFDQNPGAYVYAASTKDSLGNDVFDPTGKGPVTIVPMSTVNEAPGQNAIVPVPTISGGAVMEAVGVDSIVVDDPYAPGKNTEVGKAITYHVGGKTVTLYGTVLNGEQVWSAVSPFAANVGMTRKNDGTIHLTPPPQAIDYHATAAQFDSSHGTSIASAFESGKTPVEGTYWKVQDPNDKSTTITVTWKNGTLFTSTASGTGSIAKGDYQGAGTPMTPMSPVSGASALSAVLDKSKVAAGSDPTTDFHLPALAALAESQSSTSAVVAAWNNPSFQQSLYQQELAYAGGDATKFAQIAAEDQKTAENIALTGSISHSSLWLNDQRHGGANDPLLVPSLAMQKTDTKAAVNIMMGAQLRLPGVPNTFVGQGQGGEGTGGPSSLAAAQARVFNQTGAKAEGGIDSMVTPAPAPTQAPAPQTPATSMPVKPTPTPTPPPPPTPSPLVIPRPPTTGALQFDPSSGSLVPPPSIPTLPKPGRLGGV